ncbi:MAG: hypothetical protein BWY74_00329 [Firmicutes bacterium ADurb.Bin419]|nr:MAG: hypothetical protein BWY74_00329 [Firmicutes bacterium ADurb.Bin419]
MLKKLKLYLIVPLCLSMIVIFTGCSTDADVASYNLSQDADMFRILRRIVFYNGITGDYILTIEGYCSLGDDDTENKRTVTCKTGQDSYKKHFLGLSDNVTYFAEQIDSKNVSVDHYKVIFKPSTIIPDVDIK